MPSRVHLLVALLALGTVFTTFKFGTWDVLLSLVPRGITEIHAANGGNVTAVWANDGGDKVTRDELRATSDPASVLNSMWDGAMVSVHGARNEVVAFNLVLEAASAAAANVSVSFNQLTGPGGGSISSSATTGDGIFVWTSRKSRPHCGQVDGSMLTFPWKSMSR